MIGIVFFVSDQKAGVYRVTWGGRNEGGQSVSTGMYFCRLITSSFAASNKMLLLK